jgi:type 1 glutamine amidotransferase
MRSLRPIPALLLTALFASAANPAPLRALLVTGGHDHELSFYEMFLSMKGYEFNVNPHPKAFRANMEKKYDVVVLYDLAEFPDDEKPHIKRYLEAGKGMVVLHHAVCSNQDWQWWYEEVVGGSYRLKAGPLGPASTYKHDIDFTVRPVAKHPVLDGITAPFDIRDEAYGGMWVSPKSQPLLETEHPLQTKTMAWISPYPKARVVYIQLGHGSDAHRHPSYRRLVDNAMQWAAGRK